MGTEVMSSWDIPALADYLPSSSVAIGSEQKYFFFLINDRIIPLCYILSNIHIMRGIE